MRLFNCSYIVALGLAASIAYTSPSYAADSQDEVTTILVQGSTLEDFFNSALEYSPRIRIADESRKIGTQRKKAATGVLLPQLTASGSLSDNSQEKDGTISDYPGKRYSLQLTQVLFNWQNFAARAAASLLEDQAEAEYFSELGWLLTDVAEKYFDVLQADDTVTSIRAEVEATANQLNQIERLYSVQSAQITDLYDTQARLAAVQAQQLVAENELAIAKEALRAVSGINVGDLFRLDEEIEIPKIETPLGDWLDQAKDQNPQIRARIYAARAADKQVSQAKGAFMPTVNVVVQKQISDIGYDNQMSDRRDSEYIGLNVTIPLYTGGRNSASMHEAQSHKNIADNQLRQMRLDVIERTRTAYLQIKSSEQQVQAAKKLAEATTLAYTARQRGFELGVVTSVDVLNALRDRFQAEREYHRMRYDQIRYRLFLERESGSISAQDLVDVGNWLVAPE